MSGNRARLLVAVRASGCAVVLATLISAGNVLRVGPGRTFADVQSAVDAASAGDLVLVDAGAYPRFVVDGKELVIAADGASFTLTGAPGQPELTVRNVPAGRTVTVHGVRIAYDDRLAPAVWISGNAGAVRLSELEVDESANLIDAGISAAVLVEATATFWLLDSSVWSSTVRLGNTLSPLCAGTRCNDGISALELRDSSGAIHGSKLLGYFNDYTALGSGGDGLRAVGNSELRLYESEITPGHPAVFAGSHGIFGGNAVHQVRAVSAPHLIRSCSSGGRTPVYTAGTGSPALGGEQGGFYGFNNDNGSYQVHGVVLYRFVGHCEVPEWNEVALDPRVVALGGTLAVHLRSGRERAYALLLSDSTRHGAFTAFAGRAMLDPARILHVSFGTTPKNVITTRTFPVASAASLIGLQLTAQSVSGPVGGALASLSLPGMAVIGP